METTSTVSSSTAFPVHPVRLSFQPFVGFLKTQQEASLANDALYGLYTYLIDQFERLPDPAGEPLEDILGSKRLTNLFQLAALAVLPMTSTGRDIPYAFGLPMPFTVFHQSAAFGQLLKQFPGLLTELPEQICVEDKLRFLYRLMLEKCYGFTPGNYQEPSFRFQREINGLTRYFQIDINNVFIEPRGLGVLPTLQPSWVDFAYGTGPLPAEPMPMDEFVCEGFAFFRIEDITETETMHQLKEVFTHLHSDTEPAIYQQFETALRNLCGEPDFQISIVPFQQVNGYFVHQPEMSARSVILRNSGTVVDGLKDPEIQQQIRMLVDHPAPQLFSDLDGLTDHKREKLYQKGIRSFMLYPIVSGNEALGIMELGSPRPDAFNSDVLQKLEQVLPLIQELLRYQLYQFNQTLEQVIKKKFTTLQPAVEWKFREAAWEYVRLGQKEAFNSEATQVRFPQVYPLYGAVDIRNSSNERHKAVCRDFSAQLTAVQELLSQAPLPNELALPDQLVAKAYYWQNKQADGFNPEDEAGASAFLADEVNPYFRHLLRHYEHLTQPIERYFQKTEAETGLFNQALLAYERSVEWVNTAVNGFIEQEEKRLQTIYPHYFERYRTDGTEYTIYVGQSISPRQPFEPDYLRRFYGWQLNAMVEMARLTRQILPALPVPLQTTQLLLAHAHPVDISFRQDEHRFDVEGSYSIRYEVLKKRIDKALIAGTQERLTQPDTLVLVYANSREVADYLPFITKLQKEGKVKPEIEYLNLEPLQGVTYLKALRLHLRYPDPA